MTNLVILSETCTGRRGNPACRNAHKAGRSVHAIKTWSATEPTLIMPSWHFATVADAERAFTEAEASAPTVRTDADLYMFREQGVPHWLPVGWIDPSRR